MVVCSIIRKTVSQKQYCNKGVTRNRTLSSRKGEISLAFAIFLLILLIFLCLWGWLHHRAIFPPPLVIPPGQTTRTHFFYFILQMLFATFPLFLPMTSVPKFLTPCDFRLLCCYFQLTQQLITHPQRL